MKATASLVQPLIKYASALFKGDKSMLLGLEFK